MLTRFKFCDDEGSFMLYVKQYLGGMRLYEDIPNYLRPGLLFLQYAADSDPDLYAS